MSHASSESKTPPVFGFEHIDKWAFVAVVVLGGVTIFGVDRADASKWIAVGICVLLMLSYTGATLWLPGLKLRPDQVADNAYYLGLLFTLVSLGTALIRFTSTDLATDSILRNFGIAIFTTIVGLALRVFVSQFREDPEDLEQEARVALSDTVSRMRRELDLCVAELRGFSDGMRQVVGEFTESTSQSTTGALEKAVGQFEKSSAVMGQRFESSADLFASRIQSFDGSLDRVVTSLEALMNRIGAVRADADVLERGLRPALEVVERAVSEFAASIVSEKDKFEQGALLVSRFSAAAGELDNAGGAMSAASAKLVSASDTLSEAASVVERFRTVTDAAALSTGSLADKLSDIGERADERAKQSVERLHSVVSLAADAAAAQAESRLLALDGAARQVIQTLERLDREFAGSGETVVTVRRELTELAGWIIARLEP